MGMLLLLQLVAAMAVDVGFAGEGTGCCPQCRGQWHAGERSGVSEGSECSCRGPVRVGWWRVAWWKSTRQRLGRVGEGWVGKTGKGRGAVSTSVSGQGGE